jgi:hypothetical protein
MKDIVSIVLAEQIQDLKEQLSAKNEEIDSLKALLKEKTRVDTRVEKTPRVAEVQTAQKPSLKTKRSDDKKKPKKSSKKVKHDGSPDMRTSEGRALAAALQLAAVADTNETTSEDEEDDVAAAAAIVAVGAWNPDAPKAAEAAPAPEAAPAAPAPVPAPEAVREAVPEADIEM